LTNTIKPMIQIAINMSFIPEWTYRNADNL
jgi:hypothetical protein